MNQELKARFDEAMMDVYRRAQNECNYKATRFLRMLHEHRGLETARILLHHASKVSEVATSPCGNGKRLRFDSRSRHSRARMAFSVFRRVSARLHAIA